MRSTRSTSRVRTSERGFVLVLAIIVAALYFGLMALMMVDSSRALVEAQRFRAKVTASACAENAIELAARNMATSPVSDPPNTNDGQCEMVSMLAAPGLHPEEGEVPVGAGAGGFILRGEATTLGVPRVKATARIQGLIRPATAYEPARIVITESSHSM